MRIAQFFGYLAEPQIDIFLVYVLFYESTFVYQRNDRFIFNAVFNGVFVDQFAKTRKRAFFVLHQRSTGETDITGVGKDGAHFGGKRAIVGAVAFINQHENITGIVFQAAAFNRVELVDDRRDHVKFTAVDELN